MIAELCRCRNVAIATMAGCGTVGIADSPADEAFGTNRTPKKAKRALLGEGGGGGHKGYSLGIRDSIMIAHSFEGPQFGPAQEMHGATYTVDAEFKTDALVEKSNWVVDIGAASEMLAAVLSKYNFKNLNEIFPGQNTTTEFMCKVIFDELAAKCGKDFHGTLCIKLWESHKAWGCYEGDVGEEVDEA